MKIFNYDAETGVYLGESEADASPLEPGKYLVPRHATDVAPPDEVEAGKALFWRGGKWVAEAVPELDSDLDGKQDAPEGFAPGRDGYFARLIKAVFGK